MVYLCIYKVIMQDSAELLWIHSALDNMTSFWHCPYPGQRTLLNSTTTDSTSMSPSTLFHITFKMRGKISKIGFLLVPSFQTFSNHWLINSLLVSDCQTPKQAITLPYNTNISFQIYSISKSLDDVNHLF